MHRLSLLLLSLCLSAPALAWDNYVWGSFGGYQGRFEAPYYGFGFMADGWGGQFGLIGRSDYNGPALRYSDPPTQDFYTVEDDILTGLPLHLSILRGYAPNQSIAFYASFGILLSRYCDVVVWNVTGNRYCANERGNIDTIPGAGVLFTLNELTLGMSYQYGIGALISVGTDF
ncbi:MAG: hypothetical protein ACX931_09545 [Saccharospirillum sp.]